jgi:hypothetical protein
MNAYYENQVAGFTGGASGIGLAFSQNVGWSAPKPASRAVAANNNVSKT